MCGPIYSFVTETAVLTSHHSQWPVCYPQDNTLRHDGVML